MDKEWIITIAYFTVWGALNIIAIWVLIKKKKTLLAIKLLMSATILSIAQAVLRNDCSWFVAASTIPNLSVLVLHTWLYIIISRKNKKRSVISRFAD
jgi:hypothetical protein